MESIAGRYAPSPTGDLHLGNLRTALLAWLQARLQGGEFYLRIEDLDTPRVVAGSTEQLIADLTWLGIDWDGAVLYQSKRHPHYQAILDDLERRQLTYPCFCSRKELREAISAPHGATPVYPGTCAALSAEVRESKSKTKLPATRLRVVDQVIQFDDLLQGRQSEHLPSDVGDFVVMRADGLFAYQLAVVVDDLDQGITDVVRGADLLGSTARQLYLAKLIAPSGNPIRYWHVPLVNDESGERMAKRDGSYSASQWQKSGRTAEQLVGEFAHQLGFIEQVKSLSAGELAQHLTLARFQQALALRN